MAKLQDIRSLAEVTAEDISRSPRDWMGYLDTPPDYIVIHFRILC